MSPAGDWQRMREVYGHVSEDAGALDRADVAHLVVHGNRVAGAHTVPGFAADVEELEDGVAVHAEVERGAAIEKMVHMCFGVLPERGMQRIVLDLAVRRRGSVSILAHCMFPNAVDVTPLKQAEITVEDGAAYHYLERHVHGPEGGVVVVPKAAVRVGRGARFTTEFELVSGRVGRMEIDYESWCDAGSSLQMIARIAGRRDDRISVRETAHLDGEGAAGALLSRIAVRDEAEADVYNELTASAPHAHGHVDCKEIVQGSAVARATPVVSVRHPLARVTHEAAIGSVDSKQLQTLMARGLSEDEAVDLIVHGLLRMG
jgi:Fe-S cluster assembly scaffold protein SufB